MDIEDLPGLEAIPPKKTPIYRRERHLASAITLTEIEIFTHRNNNAALRPHHKRILNEIEGISLMPPTEFLSWCVSDLTRWDGHTKEEKALMRRAERVSQLTMEASYSRYYKTPPSPIVNRSFPLDTIYASLATTWARVISQVAQSQEPRQEITVGSVRVVFDAELCVVYASAKSCFLIPYSLILCFSDMCAAWFSETSYAALHNDKYPGCSLQKEVGSCLSNMLEFLAQHKQKAYVLLKMWPSLVIGSTRS